MTKVETRAGDAPKVSALNKQMSPLSTGALFGGILFALVLYGSRDILLALLAGGVVFAMLYWIVWAGQYLERRLKKNQPAEPSADVPGEAVSWEALQGTWRMLECGRNGNFAPIEEIALANIRMQVQGDRFTLLQSNEGGNMVLDNSVFPTAMDQVCDDGDTHLCVARLVDGQLEICQGEPGRARPKDFSRKRRDGASLTRFVRVVAASGKPAKAH